MLRSYYVTICIIIKCWLNSGRKSTNKSSWRTMFVCDVTWRDASCLVVMSYTCFLHLSTTFIPAISPPPHRCDSERGAPLVGRWRGGGQSSTLTAALSTSRDRRTNASRRPPLSATCVTKVHCERPVKVTALVKAALTFYLLYSSAQYTVISHSDSLFCY